MLLEFLTGRKKCTHERVSLECDFGYCPDCGELIENQWFITRCSCCGVKQKSIIRNGKVVPLNKYCHNCGSNTYIVEQLEKINFIDINYAVLMQKAENNFSVKTLTQCWVDATGRNDGIPKLLPLFR